MQVKMAISSSWMKLSTSRPESFAARLWTHDVEMRGRVPECGGAYRPLYNAVWPAESIASPSAP